jgi:hypothetical protein
MANGDDNTKTTHKSAILHLIVVALRDDDDDDDHHHHHHHLRKTFVDIFSTTFWTNATSLFLSF